MSEKFNTVDFGASVKFGAHVFRVEIAAAKGEFVVLLRTTVIVVRRVVFQGTRTVHPTPGPCGLASRISLVVSSTIG